MNSRQFIFWAFWASLSVANAQHLTISSHPENVLHSAHSLPRETLPNRPTQHSEYDAELNQILQNLSQNQPLTERVLDYLLVQGNLENIRTVLTIYQAFPQTDPLLVKRTKAQIAEKSGNTQQAIAIYREILADHPDFTPTRVQLSLAFMRHYHHNAARAEFKQILQDSSLPIDIASLIQQAEYHIKQRDRWKWGFSANYLRESNINSVSNASQIENTGFVKNSSMLPQKAHGIEYSLNVEKETNLIHAHYLHFSSYLNGKSYWDNHDYDELINRTYLGYQHKWIESRLSLLPFYERTWYANHRYRKTLGVRTAFNHWLNEKWQLALAMEYGKLFYDNNANLNGHNKFISLSLHYFPNSKRGFFIGSDFLRENTRLRHHSYDLKTLRFGWNEQWAKQIHTRLSYSFSERNYKDNLMLGRSFHFSRPRVDRIYQFSATLWKQDWQLPFDLIPKLQYRWKKQRSTFPSLYNYRDHSLNLVVERHF